MTIFDIAVMAQTPLLEQLDQLEEENERLQKRVAELETAVRDLLISADATWEDHNIGHDWPEACKRARRLLPTIKVKLKKS